VSLVNEMLRDLDARRRDVDAPRADADGKLLPPATREAGLRPLAVLAVLMAALAGAALALFLANWLRSNGSEASQAPVMVPGDTVTAMAPVDEALLELRAMGERLQALETQNRALQQRADAAQAELQAAEQRVAEQEQAVQLARLEAERQALAAVAQRAVTPAQPRSGARLMAPAPDRAPAVLAPQPAQAPSAFAQTPGGTEALQRTARELSLRERDRQQVQDALRLWAANEHNAALQALDVFAMEHPEAHQSRETLAKLLIERGDVSAASQAADIGLMIAPLHPGYRKIRARLLLANNDAAPALALLVERPPALRTDPEYHDLLASAALAAGDYERALLAYEQLLDVDDSMGRWWYGLAAALDAEGRSNAAIQAYEQALRSADLGASLRQISSRRLNQLQQ